MTNDQSKQPAPPNESRIRNAVAIAGGFILVGLLSCALHKTLFDSGLKPSTADLATVEAAKAFSSKLAQRPTYHALVLSGTSSMPDEEVIAILHRGIAAKPTGPNGCPIWLKLTSNTVDYELAVALAGDLKQVVCMSHKSKVPGGETALDLYLSGGTIPESVSFIDL